MARKRLYGVLRTAALIFAIGVAYGIFFQHTGIGIACPFRFVTGLKCPGCGVTHMCVALLQLDLAAAFAAHPALLLLSPVLAAVFLGYLWTYIRKGHWKLCPFQNVLLWICIAALALYGIARNVFGLP